MTVGIIFFLNSFQIRTQAPDSGVLPLSVKNQVSESLRKHREEHGDMAHSTKDAAPD